MSKLNKDILFLILKELKNDRKSIYSCLLVDRTWCEATVPILWKNPLKFCPTVFTMNMLFNVIILHLSKESMDILKNQKVSFTEIYQRPLFNYISFWKYLHLSLLEGMIASIMNIEM